MFFYLEFLFLKLSVLLKLKGMTNYKPNTTIYIRRVINIRYQPGRYVYLSSLKRDNSQLWLSHRSVIFNSSLSHETCFINKKDGLPIKDGDGKWTVKRQSNDGSWDSLDDTSSVMAD